jgi:hypothetical protein
MLLLSGNHKSTAGNIGKPLSGISGLSSIVLVCRDNCCPKVVPIVTATFACDWVEIVAA